MTAEELTAFETYVRLASNEALYDHFRTDGLRNNYTVTFTFDHISVRMNGHLTRCEWKDGVQHPLHTFAYTHSNALQILLLECIKARREFLAGIR